jgi:hypothetical protein
MHWRPIELGPGGGKRPAHLLKLSNKSVRKLSKDRATSVGGWEWE